MMRQERGLNDIARQLSEDIPYVYGEKMGFALIVFRFDDTGMGDYISNCMREDMIVALQEVVDRLKNRESIPVTRGEA